MAVKVRAKTRVETTAQVLSLVLSYRDPEYGRFRALLEAGLALPGWQVNLMQNTSSGIWRYWETFWKVFWQSWTRVTPLQGVTLLGFRGLEFYWILRFLIGKQPIILDALVSPTLSLRTEKQGSWIKVFLPLIEKIENAIYQNVEAILVDTVSHKKALQEIFPIKQKKIFVLPVGAEDKLFQRQQRQETKSNNKSENARFTVLYYFSGQKLHGTEQISNLLQSPELKHIQFLLVGPVAQSFYKYANATTLPSVPYRLLPGFINKADLCLVGPFNDSAQARRVITTKTFQCLAVRKPVIVGKNPETAEVFTDKKDAFVVPLADPKTLQKAILWASTHPRQLSQIAQAGHKLYLEKFSVPVRAQQLQKVLDYVQSK